MSCGILSPCFNKSLIMLAQMSLLDTVQRIFFNTKQEVILKMYDKSLLFQKGGMPASPRVFGVT